MKKHCAQLDGLPAWVEFFDSPDQFLAFDDVDIQIQLFAGGDTAWMLLSHYTSPKTATEYTFMPTTEEDKPNSRRHIFDFLQTLHYSLPALLAWLETAPFVDTDITDEVTVGRVTITRSYARATEPYIPQSSDVNDVDEAVFEEYDDEKNPG